MDDTISRLIEELDRAKTPDEEDKVISGLAEVGSSAIPGLLQWMRSRPPRASRRETVMRVLQRMGYPANRSELPFVVAIAADTNSPGWDTALEILKGLGEIALPEIRKALSLYVKDLDEYGCDIQGLCILLEQMGAPVIDPLLPELLHLLEIGTDDNFVDEYALWPLRKIGSPKADAVIPLLHDRIVSNHRECIRRASIEALQDFDPSVVRPLVPILRECLSDESEAIRTSARQVLDALGEPL